MEEQQQMQQEAPIEVQQPTKRFPNATQKKILIYGGIVILLLLCALGYSYYVRNEAYQSVIREAERMQQDIVALQEKRKAQDPTLNWLTYRNEEYGFEVKHPERFALVFSGDQFAFEDQNTSEGFVVNPLELAQSYEDVETWADQQGWPFPDNNWRDYYRITQIAGRKALQNEMAVILLDKNRYFDFDNGLGREDRILMPDDTFNQILSTFKFIDIIPIQAESDIRVFYTTDSSVDKKPLMEDCEKRGGQFDACGRACAGTTICAATAVCAFTCELKPE